MPVGEYFFIKSHLNGLVVNVTTAINSACAKLSMAEKKATGHDNQLWFLHRDTDTLRSRLNGHVLDFQGDTLLLQAPHENMARWQVSGCMVQSRQQPKKVLDIIKSDPNPGARMGLEEYCGGANQHWNLEYTDPPYFYIRTLMSNRVLDIANDDKSPKAKVIMFQQKPYTAYNQLWYTDRQGNIRSKLNDFAFDIGSNGRIMMMPFDSNNANHQWRFEDGYIVNHNRKDEVLDIVAAKNSDSAELCAFKRHGGTNQQWSQSYV